MFYRMAAYEVEKSRMTPMDDYEKALCLLGQGRWRAASVCLTTVLESAEDFLTWLRHAKQDSSSDGPELLRVLLTLHGTALEWNRLCHPRKANQCYTVLLRLLALATTHQLIDSSGPIQLAIAQISPAMIETRIWTAEKDFTMSATDLLTVHFHDLHAEIGTVASWSETDRSMKPLLQLTRACLDLLEVSSYVCCSDVPLSIRRMFQNLEVQNNHETQLLQVECVISTIKSFCLDWDTLQDGSLDDFNFISNGWKKCVSMSMAPEVSANMLEYFKLYVDICRKLNKAEKAAEDIISAFEHSWCHCGRWLITEVAGAFLSAASSAYLEYEDTTAKKFYEHSALLYHHAADERGCVPQQAGQCYLRIGLIHYRTSEYQAASEWLLKAQSIYEQALRSPREPGGDDPLQQIAVVTAWIASSFSHLRSLEETIKYCKKTIQLSEYLDEVIIHDMTGNLGEAYHQMGANLEMEGRLTEATSAYNEAEKAFRSLLSACTTPFLFLTYGYFLLRRARHQEAQDILMQAFLNFPHDPFCSSFREEERPILLPDILFEVEQSEKHEVMIPGDICVLYLRTISLLEGQGSQRALEHSLAQLEELVRNTNYTEYQDHTPDYTPAELQASSLACLGYVHRHRGYHEKALDVFRSAHEVNRQSSSARINVEREQQFLSVLGEDCDL